MQSKIYLSYDKQQKIFADLLDDELQSWGYTTWIPSRDIADSDKRLEAIEDNLRTSNIVIGILSQATLSNVAVRSEWNWSIVYQHQEDTRLLLLRVDDCIIPAVYHHIPRIDVHTVGKTQALQSLKNALQTPDSEIPKYEVSQDEFCDYLIRAYNDVVSELQFLVIPPDDSEQQVHMSRTYSHQATENVLASFEAGFEQYKQRAFLVGDPGVGKTITLLMKAIDAILERLQDENAPLPFIGSVVTWKALENIPLHKWLAKYTRLPAEKIEHELANGNCLLLLDGVDELGSMRRDKVVGSFDPRQRFLEHLSALPSTHQVLITCRTESYADIPKAHQLNGTIFLEQLSDVQIQQFLVDSEHGNPLWEIVQSQPDLLETIRLPLLLGVFAFAYHKIPDVAKSLSDLNGGALRDAIFERYVMRRFKIALRHYEREKSSPPFTVDDIYTILGKVSKHGAIKYGTGEVAFITPDDAEYGDWIAIQDMTFGFVGDDNVLADEFVKFASQLHLINMRGSGTCTFVHRLMRNHFVFKFCVPVLPDVDTYAIDALGKIRDERVPDILVGIIKGNFPDNIKRHALSIYENLGDKNLARN